MGNKEMSLKTTLSLRAHQVKITDSTPFLIRLTS